MSSPRRPGVIRSGLRLGIAAIVVVVLLPLVGGLPSLLGMLNPFTSERHERADTAVLSALDDLSEYRAARAELQVVVEIEDDRRFLPHAVAGKRTTFLAGGEVDAYVDLGGIGAGAVETTPDGGVIVTLPPPRIADPRVDPERSRVVNRSRGFFDRVGDALSSNPGDDRALHLLAQEELLAAAGETELLERAEANAEALVRDLLREAGIEDVEVVFEVPEAATA